MQAEDSTSGATPHVECSDKPLVLFGVPITRKVYAPTAPGSASEAVEAGDDMVAVPTSVDP